MTSVRGLRVGLMTAKFRQWLGKGLRANAAGDGALTAVAFRKALRIDPSAAAAWSGLGLALLCIGRTWLSCPAQTPPGTDQSAHRSASDGRDSMQNALLPAAVSVAARVDPADDSVRGRIKAQMQACLAGVSDARALVIQGLHLPCHRRRRGGRDPLSPQARNGIGRPRIGELDSCGSKRAAIDDPPPPPLDGLVKDLDGKVVDVFEHDLPQHLADMIGLCACAYSQVLDLGCGEGLMISALGEKVERATGVDISGAILTAAQEKAVYDVLFHEDISMFFLRCRARFDLVIAADVFNCFDALDNLFADIHRVLARAATLPSVSSAANTIGRS